MAKFEYRVSAAKRMYSWDMPFYYVERRVPSGEWRAISCLTKDEREEVSYSYLRRHNPEDAIATVKRLERKHHKWDRKKVSITLAFPSVEDKRKFLYVSSPHGWWKSYDDISVRLYHYKDIKKHFRKNPYFVQSETAILDGEYNVENYSNKGLTADLSRPFLISCEG